MAELPIDIEKVVREVLAEMGLAPEAGNAASGIAQGATGSLPARAPRALADKPPVAPGAQSKPGHASTAQAAAEKPAQDGGPLTPSPSPARGEGSNELIVGSRVVTLAELGDRLGAVRRVVVGAGAVVTPAARDELLRCNIALVYAEPEPLQRPSRPRLAVFATGTKADPAGLLKGLHEEGIATECERLDCLIATVDALVVELAKPGTLGLLLTEHAAAALCLANRVRGVRAVWGIDAASVARDGAAVGANLLVADPAAAGPFVLKQMVVQFCRQGPRDCPEVFRQRLG